MKNIVGLLGFFTTVHYGLYSYATITFFDLFQMEVSKSKNTQLAQLFESGFGIHHAGMVRAHRGLTERLFADGLLKVCSYFFDLLL